MGKVPVAGTERPGPQETWAQCREMSEGHQYRKHYTRDEARALLPKIRTWLDRIRTLREQLAKAEQRLTKMSQEGRDTGGDLVNSWIRVMAESKELFLEFQSRDIQIKDLSRGLIDFPAFVAGKEVFLCW